MEFDFVVVVIGLLWGANFQYNFSYGLFMYKKMTFELLYLELMIHIIVFSFPKINIHFLILRKKHDSVWNTFFIIN
jgi:hypothetical protein